MKWLEFDDRMVELTEADCAQNSYPLSTVRNVSVVSSTPESYERTYGTYPDGSFGRTDFKDPVRLSRPKSA